MKARRWTIKEDEMVCDYYFINKDNLYGHIDDLIKEFDENGYDDRGEVAIRMRLANYQAIDTGRGLINYSKQSKNVYLQYIYNNFVTDIKYSQTNEVCFNKTDLINQYKFVDNAEVEIRKFLNSKDSCFSIEFIINHFKEVVKYWVEWRYGMDKPLYIKKLYKRYFDTLKSLLIYLNNKENLTLIEKEFVENLIYRGPIERFIPISKEDSNKPNFGIVPSSFYYSWSTNFPKNNVYLMNLKAGAEYCVRLFTNITSPEFGIYIGNKKYNDKSIENEVIFTGSVFEISKYKD